MRDVVISAQRALRSSGIVGCALVLLGADCGAGGPDDCFPFVEGDQLRLMLVEPYDEDTITRYYPSFDTGGVPSCDGFDGLMPGANVDFRIATVEEMEMRCESHRAEIEAGAPQPDPEGDPSAEGGGPIYAHGFITTTEGCEGRWVIGLHPDPEQPFGEVRAGAEPPVIVTREFRTDNVDTCPMFPSDTGRYLCEDVWVGTIEMR